MLLRRTFFIFSSLLLISLAACSNDAGTIFRKSTSGLSPADSGVLKTYDPAGSGASQPSGEEGAGSGFDSSPGAAGPGRGTGAEGAGPGAGSGTRSGAETPGAGGIPSASPRCGDGVCNGTEVPATCPVDCFSVHCGDRVCDSVSETSTSCLADCPRSSGCNNDGLCDATETYSTCIHDCPLTPGCNFDGTCDASSGETSTTCSHDCPDPGTPTPGDSGDFDVLPITALLIPPGMHVDYSLQITRHAGFSGDVAVHVTPLAPTAASPGGAITVDPLESNIRNPANSIILQVTAADAMVGSRFTVNVSLTASGISRSVSIPVDVISASAGSDRWTATLTSPCTSDIGSVWVGSTASGGNDSNPGTISAPISSLLIARDRAAASTPAKNVCVFEGSYQIGRSGYTNFSLRPTDGRVKVNFYGGFHHNSAGSVVRSHVEDSNQRLSILSNDSSVPVVTFSSTTSTDPVVFEGFRILQDGNRAPSSTPIVSIDGSSPLLKNNTIEYTPTLTQRLPVGELNFQRMAVLVQARGGMNNGNGAVLDHNNIKVGNVSPRFGSAVGIQANLSQLVTGTYNLTLTHNTIEVGSAGKASIGILGTSAAYEENSTNFVMEDNKIIFNGARQAPARPDGCTTTEGGTSACADAGYVYEENQGGQSGGIILGMSLSNSSTDSVLVKRNFTAARILRNTIHPKLLPLSFSSGYSSYGIALEGGSVSSVVGSNMVQGGIAQSISTALYVHKTTAKIYNNTLRSGSVRVINANSCATIGDAGDSGGPGIPIINCTFEGMSAPVFIDDQSPTFDINSFSNLEFVNNIFSSEPVSGTVQTAGVFELDNHNASRARSNFNSIKLFRNNWLDPVLSFDFTFYRVGEVELWRIPLSELSTIRNRIRYASAGGQTAASINNIRSAPGLVYSLFPADPFNFHLLEDAAARGGGDCSFATDILSLNPKEIDGTNFPTVGCDVGADQYVAP